eukprot:638572-Amphidinium_carterae.1
MYGPPGRGILSLEWITKLEADAFHERMNELGYEQAYRVLLSTSHGLLLTDPCASMSNNLRVGK